MISPAGVFSSVFLFAGFSQAVRMKINEIRKKNIFFIVVEFWGQPQIYAISMILRGKRM
jgi:hypothetical protein